MDGKFTKLRSDSRTAKMLRHVIKCADEANFMAFLPLKKLILAKTSKEYWRDYTALKRLEQMGYLESDCTKILVEYRLTFFGEQEAVRLQIVNERTMLPPGFRLFVSYDIPEYVRYLRYELATTLRKAGFVRVHQSLWATVKDVGEDILGLIGMREDIDLDWVKVYLGYDCPIPASVART